MSMPMFDAYSTAALCLVAASAVVAGLARGFSGVGGALIFIPLASAAVGAKLAVPVLLVVDTIVAASLIPNAWRMAQKPDVGLMALGALAGVPLGTWILTRSDPVVLRWIVAVTVCGMLALLISGWRYRGRSLAVLSVGVGALSGFFSGVSQIGGPPILVYYIGRAIPAATVRANIVLYFAISTVVTIASYLLGGLLTTAVLVLALVTTPFYALGLFLGSRMFGIASEDTFRRVCYAIVAAAALVSLPIWDGLAR
jgi:uncharacterized membrane protein YfcA